MKARCITLVFMILAPILALLVAAWRIERSTGLRPGDRVPEAVLQTPDGESVDTRSWRGTPVVLVLFIPTCSACLAEIKSLEKIAAMFPDLRITLLSQNASPPASKMKFPVLLDPGGEFLRRTRRAVVPALYWIDAAGQVRHVRTGRHSLQSTAALCRSLVE